jgi:hypothetical protein
MVTCWRVTTGDADTVTTTPRRTVRMSECPTRNGTPATPKPQPKARPYLRSCAACWPGLPARELLDIVGLPDVPALTASGFDLAAELLAAQRDFALTLANTFAPAKTA